MITSVGNLVLERSRTNKLTNNTQIMIMQCQILFDESRIETHPSSVSLIISQISMFAAQSSDGKFPSVAFSKRMISDKFANWSPKACAWKWTRVVPTQCKSRCGPEWTIFNVQTQEFFDGYKHDENGCKNVNYHYKVPILCPTGVEKGFAPNREAILESLVRMTSYVIYSVPRTGNFLPRISHPNLAQ